MVIVITINLLVVPLYHIIRIIIIYIYTHIVIQLYIFIYNIILCIWAGVFRSTKRMGYPKRGWHCNSPLHVFWSLRWSQLRSCFGIGWNMLKPPAAGICIICNMYIYILYIYLVISNYTILYNITHTICQIQKLWNDSRHCCWSCCCARLLHCSHLAQGLMLSHMLAQSGQLHNGHVRVCCS